MVTFYHEKSFEKIKMPNYYHKKMINLTVVDGVTNILKKHQPPEQATQVANASNTAANTAPVRQRQPQTRMHRGRDNVVRRYIQFSRAYQFSRSIADLIDMAFAFHITIFVILLNNVLNSKETGTRKVFGEAFRRLWIDFFSRDITGKLILFLISFWNEFFLTLTFGRTPGKFLFKLRVIECFKVAHNNRGYVWVSPGTKPKRKQLFIRSIFKVLGFLFFPLFHLTASGRHRTFYDILTGTLIVQDPPEHAHSGTN